MTTIAEKREPLPPIGLSSIVFEDEEDGYEWPSTTSSSSSASCSVSSSPISSSVSSSSSIPSSASSTPSTTNPSPARRFLEPTDHSTDFLWPMGTRPLELRAPPCLIHQVFVPNNNGIDEIINGPGGQVAPATRPPIASPKWDWEPKLTMMKHVSTIHHHTLEPTDFGSSFLWPLGICPLKVGGPFHRGLEKVQAVAVAVAPDNNDNDIDDEIIMKGRPGDKMMAPSPKYDWGPSSMTMMMRCHARKMPDEIIVLPSPPPSPASAAVQLGNGVLFGAIGVVALVRLWFLE